jgi:cytochrome c oxidase cbb3-type subunit 4
MYKDVLRTIENVEIWPLISLIIFFLFFIGVAIYLLTIDRKFIKKMKELPMDDGTVSPPVTEENRNNQEFKQT